MQGPVLRRSTDNVRHIIKRLGHHLRAGTRPAPAKRQLLAELVFKFRKLIIILQLSLPHAGAGLVPAHK